MQPRIDVLERDLDAHGRVVVGRVPCNPDVWGVSETMVILRRSCGCVLVAAAAPDGLRQLPIGLVATATEALYWAEMHLKLGPHKRVTSVERFWETMGLAVCVVVHHALSGENSFHGVDVTACIARSPMGPIPLTDLLCSAHPDFRLVPPDRIEFDPAIGPDAALLDGIRKAWTERMRRGE